MGNWIKHNNEGNITSWLRAWVLEPDCLGFNKPSTGTCLGWINHLYRPALHNLIVAIVVQSLSHVWLFLTPWTAAHQASFSFTVSQSLRKFISIETVMLSNHLTLCHPLLLLPSIFPSIKVFSNESAHSSKRPKILKLQLQHQSFQWIFRVAYCLLSEVKSLSRVWLFATPWTVAHQASLSMGFSRQEYWSGVPFPSPGDLPSAKYLIFVSSLYWGW